MLTKIPRVVDLSKQVLSTDRGMANTRMILPSGRAKKLAETVLGKKPMIPPSLAKASVAAGVTFGAGLPLGMTDPKDVGATFAKMQVSLQDAFKQISDSVEDASKIPQFYFMQVQEGYNEEMQKQEVPEELPPTIEEQAIKPVSLMFAEGGELDMQGTPMTPDLSGQMQPEMGEVSQAEMQEAQGALMQIVQVINMLVQQGLNEDQIMEFLAQYGINEEELDQAAQLLGVDIDALIGGQMEQPQEPMMMSAGGPSISQIFMSDPIKNITEVAMANPGDFIGQPGSRVSDADILLAQELLAQMKSGRGIFKTQEEIQEILKRRFAPESKPTMIPPMMMAGGGRSLSDMADARIDMVERQSGRLSDQDIAMAQSMLTLDNEPMMQDMSPRQRMFSIDATIENLLKQYDISVNTGNIQDAMAISEEITNLNNQKIAISEQLDPVMMAEGGGASTSIDPSYIPEYLQMLQNKQAELFNLTRKAPGINPTGLSPDMSLAKRRQQFETAKRDLRQATRALNPEVFEIYEAGQFRKLPTAFSKGAIEDYINFVNQKKQTEKKN